MSNYFDALRMIWSKTQILIFQTLFVLSPNHINNRKGKGLFSNKEKRLYGNSDSWIWKPFTYLYLEKYESFPNFVILAQLAQWKWFFCFKGLFFGFFLSISSSEEKRTLSLNESKLKDEREFKVQSDKEKTFFSFKRQQKKKKTKKKNWAKKRNFTLSKRCHSTRMKVYLSCFQSPTLCFRIYSAWK